MTSLFKSCYIKLKFSHGGILTGILFIFCIGIANAETGKGLLWKISGNGLQSASHLFGTIHSDHPSVMNLPEEIQSVFSSSRIFVGEIIFDHNTQIRLLKLMKLPAGQSLKQVLDKDVYIEAKRISEELGIHEKQFDRLQPWAIAVTLSLPKRESEVYLDTRLFTDAVNMGKPVYGLETIDEQIHGFIHMKMEDQVTLLEETVKFYPQYSRMFDELLKTYLSRDLKALMDMEKQQQSQSDPGIQNYLKQELMVNRNHRMMKKIRGWITDGGVFIAVGALHLPGEDGLINLLRKDGFEVEALY